MNNNQQVDVGTLLSSISQMLHQNKDKLNAVDGGPNGGTHGERVAQAFDTAAQAAQNADTDDAGQQLAAAAQAMKQNGQGRAVNYYANGLQQAASHFMGMKGISISDILPFLQSFLGGVRQGNPAQPGQGTMIDVLGPAVSALLGGKQQGLDPGQSAIGALTSAISGARGTVGAQGNQVDPGAASATSILGGIFKALIPGVMSAVSGSLQSGNLQSQPQTEPQYQTQLQAEPSDAAGSSSVPTTQGSGGLGGLIGNLLGGGSSEGQSAAQSQQGGQKPGWWPF